jgi:hypothetical protein
MPNREFLEKYPLYKTLPNAFTALTLDALPVVPIKMFCPTDESEQTFLMVSHYYDAFPAQNYPARGTVVCVRYRCTSCQRFDRHFMLLFGEDRSLTKVGQWPAWSIKTDRHIDRMLGDHAGLYKKGLICESQAYGIGAFGYYRRITELVIDDLLREVGGLIPDGPYQEKYQAALAKVSETTVTQDKISLVKDLLPSSLRPNGLNPLGILHSELSIGLHAESDEQCLDAAEQIRAVLAYLVDQVQQSRATAKTFTESMFKLLDKRAAEPGQSKEPT